MVIYVQCLTTPQLRFLHLSKSYRNWINCKQLLISFLLCFCYVKMIQMWNWMYAQCNVFVFVHVHCTFYVYVHCSCTHCLCVVCVYIFCNVPGSCIFHVRVLIEHKVLLSRRKLHCAFMYSSTNKLACNSCLKCSERIKDFLTLL